MLDAKTKFVFLPDINMKVRPKSNDKCMKFSAKLRTPQNTLSALYQQFIIPTVGDATNGTIEKQRFLTERKDFCWLIVTVNEGKAGIYFTNPNPHT